MSSLTPLPDELVQLLPPELLAACELRRHGRGECLFHSGANPQHMHFVVRGEVVLERSGRQGEPIVLQRTRHGFVGEASLQAAHYHCDARVLADADIVRLPVQALRRALERDPLFASRWIGMLNREVRRLRQQCERLALHRAQDRLVHLLETEGQQGRLAIDGGLKSVAAELGITHEALYRCLAAMEKQGSLRREPGALQLLERGGQPAARLSARRAGPAPRR